VTSQPKCPTPPSIDRRYVALPNVLGLLVKLEPTQAEILDAVCDGRKIPRAELEEAGALECPPKWKKAMRAEAASLFDDHDDEPAEK